jgi:DNA-binding MarR family transcriptional regulator
VNVNWMVGYNERKLQVLEYVELRRMTTSFELAGALNLEIHNARTLLKKYSRQGLLSRSREDACGTKGYEITEKGLRRLSYLKGTKSSDPVVEG